MKENDGNVNRKARHMALILAGDVGGTKTLLGAFDPLPARPRPVALRSYATTDFEGLAALVGAFIADEGVDGGAFDAACFGVAGPVIGDTAELTNVDVHIDAKELARTLNLRGVALLNDLQAMAHAVPLLKGRELETLQEGEALRGGNMALIAAGTGLGEALIHSVGGRFVPSPSEGGHADFAPRNEREIGVLRFLIDRYGRGEVEQVVSGQGLLNLHRFTHAGRPCPAVPDEDEQMAPAAISAAGMERRCVWCVEALELFVDAYGAEAGNLALRSMSTAGVYVGGGIAPKILAALVDGRFLRAFRAKQPFDGLLTGMPVHVILNEEAGLLGAAVYAAGTSVGQA
jgi:glucokinase